MDCYRSRSEILINSRLMFAEITAFSDRYEEFEKLNTEILGVSIDSVVCENTIVFHDILVSISTIGQTIGLNF